MYLPNGKIRVGIFIIPSVLSMLFAVASIGCHGEQGLEPSASEEPEDQSNRLDERHGALEGTADSKFKLVLDFSPISDSDVWAFDAEVTQVQLVVDPVDGAVSQITLPDFPQSVAMKNDSEGHRHIIGPVDVPAGTVEEVRVEFGSGVLVTMAAEEDTLSISSESQELVMEEALQVDPECPATFVAELETNVAESGGWTFAPTIANVRPTRFCETLQVCQAEDPFNCKTTPSMADLVGLETAQLIEEQGEYRSIDVRNLAAGLKHLDAQINGSARSALPPTALFDLFRVHRVLQQHYFDAVDVLDPQLPSDEAQTELNQFETEASDPGMEPSERFLLKQEMLRGLEPRE